LILASGREHHQHRLHSWVPSAWPGTDLRCAMAPRAPAETGGAPEGARVSGAGRHTAGGACDGQEQEANNTGWGTCGEMVAAPNTE
jgi:hypothetical protein